MRLSSFLLASPAAGVQARHSPVRSIVGFAPAACAGRAGAFAPGATNPAATDRPPSHVLELSDTANTLTLKCEDVR